MLHGRGARKMRPMTHPLPRLLQRVALAGVASLALGLLAAGSASANTPMKIVADSGSTFLIHDDELFAPERRYFNLSGTVFGTLGAGNANFTHKLARCHGGEVRGELNVQAYRWSNSEVATVTAWVDLYEGISCATTDFDGQSPLETFTLKIGQTHKVQLDSKNYNESAWDMADATITFRALAA